MRYLFLMLIFASLGAQAGTLSCWKSNEEGNSTPFLTAFILDSTTLTDVNLNFNDPLFKDYPISKHTAQESIEGKISNEGGEIPGMKVTKKTSPYNGMNSFFFIFGEYIYTSSSHLFDSISYTGTLMLPKPFSLGPWGSVLSKDPISASLVYTKPLRGWNSKGGLATLSLTCIPE